MIQPCSLVAVDKERDEAALERLMTAEGDVAEGNVGYAILVFEVDVERDEAAINK